MSEGMEEDTQYMYEISPERGCARYDVGLLAFYWFR